MNNRSGNLRVRLDRKGTVSEYVCWPAASNTMRSPIMFKSDTASDYPAVKKHPSRDEILHDQQFFMNWGIHAVLEMLDPHIYASDSRARTQRRRA